jgi:hypothetical protein
MFEGSDRLMTVPETHQRVLSSISSEPLGPLDTGQSVSVSQLALKTNSVIGAALRETRFFHVRNF